MQQAIAQRHDKVTGTVRWSLCNKYSVQCITQQWYQHTAEPVIDNENVKILWDVNIQNLVEHRRPDIAVLDKENNNRILMIDIVVPAETQQSTKRSKITWTNIET